MNPDAHWRIALARQSIAHYDGRLAALLVSSVAIGVVDAHSDLDLLMYWDAIPAADWRKQRVAGLNGRLLWMENTSDGDDPALHSQGEEFLLGNPGLKVDIAHKRLVDVDKLIADVAEGGEATGIKHAILGGVQAGRALYGEAIIAGWQARIG